METDNNATTAPLPWYDRWYARSLISILSGIILALAFEPYDYSFIIWFGLIPILTILWRGKKSFWRGFGMAWLFAMGWYCVTFWWIHEVGYVFFIPLPMFLGIAFLPLMAIYSAMIGLWGGLVATVFRPRMESAPNTEDMSAPKKAQAWNEWAFRDLVSSLRCTTGVAAMLVCVEWMRSSGTLAFSWNTLGMGMYHGLSLVQWAEFVGTTALSFIPAVINVILWCAGRRAYIYFKGTGKHCRTWDFYGSMVVLFILFMGGMFMAKAYSHTAMKHREDCLHIPVLAVQNNKSQEEKIKELRYGINGIPNMHILEYSVDFATQALKQQADEALRNKDSLAFKINHPAWIIWPESAFCTPLTLNTKDNSVFTKVQSFCAETGKDIAKASHAKYYQSWVQYFLTDQLPICRDGVGIPFVLFTGADAFRCVPTDKGEFKIEGMLNTMACFCGDDEQSIQIAAKQHLMPFGEYIPLADSCEWIRNMYSEITGTQVGDGIHPGEGDEPLTVPVPGTNESVGVIPAVCYEDTVGPVLTKFVRKGPQVIVNISNDAWFRHSACGKQQARNAAFRCIELRRAMVRSANMGTLCAIAPNGAFIESLEDSNAPGYIYAELPADKNAGFTLFAIAGNWAVFVCLLIVLANMIPSIIRRFKKA